MLSRRGLFLSSLVPLLRAQNPSSMFRNADAYDRFMGRWSRLLAPRFVEFAAFANQGRVLDVGSGTGALAFAIAERHRGVTVVGVDPSREYVAYARDRNPFSSRAAFEQGDAQQLRFETASFDAAASLLVFNFIPDPKKAIRELRRVVRPGGTVSAAVWDYGDGMRMLRLFWDAAVRVDPAAASPVDEKNMPLCRSGELSALWKEAGLDDVRERPIEVATRFASFADYWDPFLLGQGPAGAYAQGLAPEKREALRQDVRSRLALAGDQAPFELTARVWAVRGVIPRQK